MALVTLSYFRGKYLSIYVNFLNYISISFQVYTVQLFQVISVAYINVYRHQWLDYMLISRREIYMMAIICS